MKILYTILIVLMSAPGFAQLTWESRASIPNQGLAHAVSFSIGGKIYVGLGQNFDKSYNKELWEYDPDANTWTKKATYPGNGSRSAIAMVIGSRVFAGMGQDGSGVYDDFYEYNVSSDTWTKRATFPGGDRIGSGTFVIGDSGYLVLGSCGGPNCYNDELWMYVPATNSWKQMADWPSGNAVGPVTFSIDGYGYAGNAVDPNHTLSNDFYRYDPSSNSWSKIATMPGTKRQATGAFVLRKRAYVGFGTFGYPPTGFANDMYRYNPVTNSWSSQLNSTGGITARGGSICLDVLDDSLVFGGYGNGDNGYISDYWQLKTESLLDVPAFDRTEQLITILPNPNAGNFALKFKDHVDPDIIQVRLFDVNGKIVESQVTGTDNNVFSIDVKRKIPGHYFVVVYLDERAFYSAPIELQ